MASLEAATRASVPISRSMLTICLMRRSQSQKPMMVSTRSSRRKILSTVVLYLIGGVSSSRGHRGFATIRGNPASAPVRRHQPAYAIIAPLSVQSAGRG